MENKNRAGRPEKSLRVSGLIAAAALVAICFALGIFLNWLGQLSDSQSLPAYAAFDILVVLGLVEGVRWLSRLNDQVQSGELSPLAALKLRLFGWHLIIMPSDEEA